MILLLKLFLLICIWIFLKNTKFCNFWAFLVFFLYYLTKAIYNCQEYIKNHQINLHILYIKDNHFMLIFFIENLKIFIRCTKFVHHQIVIIVIVCYLKIINSHWFLCSLLFFIVLEFLIVLFIIILAKLVLKNRFKIL